MLANQPQTQEQRRQEWQHGDQRADQKQQDQAGHRSEDDRRDHRNRELPPFETQGQADVKRSRNVVRAHVSARSSLFDGGEKVLLL
jgi:hypothetical protein